MTTAFQPMSPEEKVRFRTEYLAYLRKRDGVPDLLAHRFDVRERTAEARAKRTAKPGFAAPAPVRGRKPRSKRKL
jgi:hypothetical protein